jgi:hypothetical protein
MPIDPGEPRETIATSDVKAMVQSLSYKGSYFECFVPKVFLPMLSVVFDHAALCLSRDSKTKSTPQGLIIMPNLPHTVTAANSFRLLKSTALFDFTSPHALPS